MMMKSNRRIAIIGAGVAGLTLANLLQREHHTTIFQINHNIAGRTLTLTLEKQQQHYNADLGANIIDFQGQTQEKKVRSFLRSLNKEGSDRLKILNKPFMIYQKNVLRNADYPKDRYYYQNGFKQLIKDLVDSLDASNIKTNSQVIEIKRMSNNKWTIMLKDGACYEFDDIVLGCNNCSIKLMGLCGVQSLIGLARQLQKVEYTKQLSCALQLFNQPQFSCVLFKQHPISFISSHQEKYNHQPPLVVIQFNQQFSQTNFHQTDAQIYSRISDIMPAFIQPKQLLAIYRWPCSLIRQKWKYGGVRWGGDSNIWLCGDMAYGSSRVTGAIQSSLDVFAQMERRYKLTSNL